jgi:flagellin
VEKLSSGYNINRAADNASGLVDSEKMRAIIRGLGQVDRNIADGISLVNTADGAIRTLPKRLGLKV